MKCKLVVVHACACDSRSCLLCYFLLSNAISTLISARAYVRPSPITAGKLSALPFGGKRQHVPLHVHQRRNHQLAQYAQQRGAVIRGAQKRVPGQGRQEEEEVSDANIGSFLYRKHLNEDELLFCIVHGIIIS